MKAAKRNNKLKCAIILSLVLHCILIAVLIWSSIHHLQEIRAGENNVSIDAMIVDPAPAMVVQQYNSQHQRDKQIQKNQHVEQQKQIEAVKRSQVQRTQSKTAVVKRQEKVEVNQAATEVKKKAEVKKKQAAVQKKTAIEAAKQSKEVDNLLSRLTDTQNTLRVSSQLGADSIKQSDSSGMEINTYQAMISNAIKNKFYDYTSYIGKTCDLHIKIGPDGRLISVSTFAGDPGLCQAAISAAKAANIPRPPSLQIYEIFKNTTLKFAPR